MPPEEIPRELVAHLGEEGKRLVQEAYRYALSKHVGQKRASGEPYIVHPLGVAEILAELKMDSHTIAAALLHDTVEDTETELREIEERFGPDIAFLVNGVTKIKEYGASTERSKAENFRKLLLAVSRDLRVLIIKLADRLHNLRTLEYLPPESRRRIAEESLEVYAPIAHRLGIWRIKWEMEDLAFRFLYPALYRQILKKVRETREYREQYIKRATEELSNLLREAGIKADVEGRPKHIYSIYQKILRKGVSIDEIYDLYGIRVITLTVADCYAALGVIHGRFRPLPGRFKDYIAMPKPNLYQSLHTTVIGPGSRFLEIQIRTRKMHELAEKGIAAHWRYKEDFRPTEKEVAQFSWLRGLLELYRRSPTPEEFMRKIREEITGEEIYVFTPKGDVITLPIGSTPVDFAYEIHTQLGHRVRAAKVNGRPVPLSTVLESGDVVEIIPKKKPRPRKSWLEFVKTSKARNRIRHWFRVQERERDLERGRSALIREFRRTHRTFGEKEIEKAIAHFNFKDEEDLYLAIARGTLAPRTVYEFFHGPAFERKKKVRKGKYPIIVEGMVDLEVSVAKCCNPVPGDDIAGIVTSQKKISIHRKDCPYLKKYGHPDRILRATWGEVKGDSLYPVKIRLRASTDRGLRENIETAVTRGGGAAEFLSLKRLRGGDFALEVRLYVRNRDHLRAVLDEIHSTGGVLEIRGG